MGMRTARSILIWSLVAAVLVVPIVAAAASPLLAWRRLPYIVAGLAGVVALALLLIQPLLIGGYLPGFTGPRARRLHRRVGSGLIAAVVIHVGGLWITSPPDVTDALLFTSPTPFSAWGVGAMWAAFAVAVMAALRRPLRLRPRTWRISHGILAMAIIGGTVVHALLIEGTMETVSKMVLCASAVAATFWVLAGRRARSR